MAHRPTGARPRPAWQRARDAARERYLLARDGEKGPEPPAELELPDRCAVDDVIQTGAVISGGSLTFMWRITARNPADEPYAAELVVTSATLADLRARRVYP